MVVFPVGVPTGTEIGMLNEVVEIRDPAYTFSPESSKSPSWLKSIQMSRLLGKATGVSKDKVEVSPTHRLATRFLKSSYLPPNGSLVEVLFISFSFTFEI